MLSPDKLQVFVENVQYTPKPILEATFYGKNAELLKVEALLDEMVALGHQNKSASKEFSDKMYELSVRLGKLFGFSSFQINNSVISLLTPKGYFKLATSSGCTLVRANIVKYTKYAANAAVGGNTELVDFDRSHKGIRFKSNAKYNMRMFIGTQLFEEHGEYSLSGGEILAIVLHEIGHNFYIGPVREFGGDFLSLCTTIDLTRWLIGEIQFVLVNETVNVADQLLGPESRKAFTWITNAIGAITRPFTGILRLRNILLNLMHISAIIGGMILSIPYKAGKAFLKYDSEKYSDAFATSYGYGPELSSALAKMEHFTIPFITGEHEQNLLDFLFSLYRIPLSMIILLLDEHPENNGRLLNDIKYMDAAGSKITDPKLKKEWAATVQEMYRLREQTKQYSGLNTVNAHNKVQSCVQDMLNISDPKDLFSSLRPTLTKYANLDYTT